MLKKLSVIAMIFVAFFAVSVNAGQETMYFGGSLYNIHSEIVDLDDLSDDKLDMIGGSGFFGFWISEHLSVEGRFGLGLTDERADGITFNADYVASAFFRGSMFIEEGSIYLLAGISNAQIGWENSWQSDSENATDFSYGIGIDYNLSESNSLGIEYICIFDDKNIGDDDTIKYNTDISTVGIVFKHSF